MTSTTATTAFSEASAVPSSTGEATPPVLVLAGDTAGSAAALLAAGVPTRAAVYLEGLSQGLAAAHAANLLLAPRGSISLVQVIQRLDFGAELLWSWRRDADDEARRQLEETRDALTRATDRSIDTVRLEGEPVAEVLDFIERGAADLLVLGVGGSAPFERIFDPAATARLVRGTVCSVLIVPAP